MPIKVTLKHVNALRLVVHVCCIVWRVNQYYLGFTDNLGADPIKTLIHSTGMAGLNLLLLSLTISPTAKWLKSGHIVKLRRPLGLWAFAFAVCHISSYAIFELQLDLANLLEDIIERPYITVGFTAFLILLALALTSTQRIRQKLANKWQILHGYVYLAGSLIVVHFLWSVKSSFIEPLIYTATTIMLLALRKTQIKYWIKKQINS